VLSACTTADGSFSLHSGFFDEDFHSSEGALDEANFKFVRPSQLERFNNSCQLRVLDVCFGMGYNTAALLTSLRSDSSPTLECWALELDHRPLEIAVAEPEFLALWPEPVQQALLALSERGCWHDLVQRQSVRMLWGDARQQLGQVPNHLRFDLIFLDAFSPGKCPQLWSVEFLRQLAEWLAPGGRLLTYCRAAAVRNSLLDAGLELRSLLPKPGMGSGWSSGTLAFRPSGQHQLDPTGPGWSGLSAMEQEHLLTRAGVPYRDPTGQESAALILKRRADEQASVDRLSTSAWQRKWKT